MKKTFIWLIGVFSALFICFTLYLIFVVKIGPVSLRKENSNKVDGIVETIYEAGVKDLTFKLRNNSNIYYINRGLENSFDLVNIQKDLIGKKITLWHAPSRASAGGHIIQLKFKDSIYYSEWDIPLVSKN